MNARNRLLAMAALCMAAPAASAAEYRHAASHFSLTIPNNWVQVPQGHVDRINAEMKRRMPGGNAPKYEAGFQPRGCRDDYPWVSVAVLPGLRGADYDEIEKSLSRDLGTPLKKAEGAFSDLGKNLQLGSAAFDRTKNRVYIRLQMDVNDVGPVRVVGVGHLGADNLVMVYASAPENQFGLWEPDFSEINDSARFDTGHTFTPGAGKINFDKLFDPKNRPLWIGMAVALGLCVACVVFGRKKPAAPRRSGW